jgi:hypothetical protein
MSDTAAARAQRDTALAAADDDVAETAARERQKHIHTSLPGIVQSFDAKTQTAVVQPAIQRVWTEDGGVDIPACLDVPVQFLGGGGYALTFPVTKGDECLLIFSERAIDHWWANGGVQLPSEFRLHDYSDAFALVGFRSRPSAIGGLSGDGVEWRTLDGQTMFRLEVGAAYVGGTLGAVAALMGEPHQQAEATLVSQLIAAFSTLAGASTGPLVGLAAGFTAVGAALTKFQTTAAAQQNFLAQNVKVS